MQFRMPRFFGRQASGHSNADSASNRQSHRLSVRVNPQAVLLVSGSTPESTGMHPLTNRTAEVLESPIAIAAEPHLEFSESTLFDLDVLQLSASQDPGIMHTPEKKYATPSTTTNLLELPAEILIKIALMAGFRAATPLMKAHSRFARLLSDPRSWHSYTADPSSSSDVVEAHVTVTSKIHTFDHLVFGLWHQEQQTAASKNDTDRIREAHGDDQHVYVEHFTFSEAYDFLGGVELGLSRAGAVVTRFFDHRETLPCYKRALVTAVADGVLPPTAPSGEPPAGAKIDHACRDCAAYSRRTVLKSVFVFDEVPYNPRWGRDGFSWTYEFPDNRRRLRVGIKPYEGSIGYSNVRDLPGVFVSRVLVNGVELVGEEWALFQRVVQRKDC